MNRSIRCVFAVLCLVSLSITSCGDDGKHDLADAPENDVPPAPAMLSIDRTSNQFGSVTIATASPPSTFTITNTGAVASGPLVAALTGADAGSFMLSTNACTAALMPGGSCQVAVTFAPATAGHKTAGLTVAGMPGGMVSASLDGDGIASGALMVSTSVSALGSVLVGQTGTIVSTFTVTNTGAGPTGALTVTPAGSDPGDFVKSADMCSTMTLAPAATCTFTVRIAPLSPGQKSALFQISGNPGGTVSGAVNGTGLAPANLRAIPLGLDFGSVVVGQPSATLAVAIVNVGGVPSGALGQTVTGGEFAIVAGGTCAGAMLAAGTTCTTTVQFTPAGTGTRTSQLDITGAPGGTVSVLLSGVGIGANGLAISPSARAFPNTNVGVTSAAQQFTITNNAAVATGPLVTTLGGPDAGEYQVIAGSDLCSGVALAPAATCTVSVAFVPTQGGATQASLSVAGSPGGSVSASLSGLGVGPAVLSIAPPARGFGSVVTGTVSPPLTFTVTNLGGLVSGVPTVMLTGAGAGQFAIAGNGCTTTIGPGASCTIQVRFAPIATGAESATLVVMATPGGSVTANVTGDGIAAGQLVLVPSSVTFPTTAVADTSVSQTITIQNTGSATTGAISISTSGTEFPTTNTCSAPLVAGASCTATITFSPSMVGLRTATLTAMASPGGTVTAALAGTGQPRLEILSLDSGPVVDPYDFGAAIINTTTPHDVLILVRNNTSSTKPFSIAEAFGTPAQYAVISNTCGTSNTIAAAGTCTVGVRFTPTTTGAKTGTITFSIGTGAASSVDQRLAGMGIDSLVLTALNGTSFGSIVVNGSATLTFRLTNPAGSVATGPITTSVSGGPFSITADACTGPGLAPGASCLIDVRAAPTATGAITTMLGASATPGGTPSITLTATGVSPVGQAPTDIALAPSSIPEGMPTGSTVGMLSTTDPDVGDTFAYTLVGGAGSTDNAAFSITGDTVRTAGVFDFETKASYTIRVRTTDSGGQVFEKALTITVANVDEPPVAVNDTATLLEDAPATAVDVLANDTDVDAGPKMITSVTQPANGSVVVTGGGTGLTYAPAPNYCGPDSFSYTLNGGSVGTVAMTVTCDDDPPVAVGDTATVVEDTTANSIDVLANDTDIDGGPKSIQSVAQPMHGTVAITGGGTGLTYTPAANYAGADAFTYTLNGGSVGMVTVTVTNIDDPPTAVADTVSLDEDTNLLVDVIANDDDPDGGPKMAVSTTQPMHGVAALFPNGIQYTPAPNFNGNDSFLYTLNGGSFAFVFVTVRPVDDPPVAVADTATVDAGSAPTLIDVLANDTDIDAGPKTIASASDPAHGTVVVAADGLSLTYQPDAGYCNTQAGGTPDTFTYNLAPGTSSAMVSVTVTCKADLSIAISDSPDPVVPGNALTYTINVTNNGPTYSEGVSVTLPLPAGSSLTSATGTGWVCTGTTTVTCTRSTLLLVGAAPAITVVVTAPAAGGTITATATVTATTADPDTSNNTASTTTLVKSNQTITFNSTAPTTAKVGGPTYTVTATATSGLTVAFTIDASAASVCSIAGSVVSFIGAGTCVINANQAGNGTYNAAPQVQQSFAVAKADQTISFNSTAPAFAKVGGATYTVTATATSGLTVSFAIDASASSVCSIAGSTVSFIGAGTCVINANQAGNANYNAAPQAQQSFAVTKNDQTISFNSTAPVAAKVSGPTYTVTATATSGLTVAFTIDASATSVCSIAGSTVSFIGVGTCVINANQAGNGTYNAAPQVQQSFAVGKGDQTISFTSTAPAAAKVGGATYTVTATATSGLAVSITIDASAASVCSLAGSTVSFIGAGTCVINANQAGNANYNAASQVQQSFSVAKADQTISFMSTAPAAAKVGGATYTVTATATSGLTVSFTIDASAASVCTIAGSTVSFIGAGTCVIDANQAGNANYNAAPQVQQSFAVGKGDQTISFNSTAPAPGTVGGTYTVTATATSGLAVTFTIDATASSVCSIAGSTVSLVAAGTCVIDANQAGNANYNAAPQVQQSFTVVAPSPIAVADPAAANVADYVANAGIPIQIPAGIGVLANDTPNGAPIVSYGASTGSEQTTLGTATPTAQNGWVTLNANGSFTYEPPPAFTGNDTFKYTLTSMGGSSTATVTIAVAGQAYFIDDSATAGGNGSMLRPFTTLGSLPAGRGAGGLVFIYAGTYDRTDADAVSLKTGELLIGQAVAIGPGNTNLPFTLAPRSVAMPSVAAAPAISTSGAGLSVVKLGSTNTVKGLAIGNRVQSGISGTNFGTLTLGTISIAGTGNALSLDTGTLAGDFISISSSSGSTNVSLNNVAGTSNFGTGSLSGSSGDAFVMTASSATVTYGGTIAQTTANRAVRVNGNTGGTLTLSGAITASTSTANAIDLTSNTGATVAFTGALVLSTSSGTGFNATGGGTVTATGAGSTIATVPGTALNVANTTIGSGNLTFQSISSGAGASNGIVLDTTGSSGGLTVTGDGTDTMLGGNFSGGTISGKTGADGSTTAGIGIYLNNTANVVLRRMRIGGNANFGIRGFGVNNFTLEYSSVNLANGTNPTIATYGEGGVMFGDGSANGLTGSASVRRCVFGLGASRNFSVVNTAGTLNRLTITGSQFGLNQNAATARDSLAVEARNAGTVVNVTVDGSTADGANNFTGAPLDVVNVTGQAGTTMDVVFKNNAVSNGHGQNVVGAGGLTIATFGVLTFDVNHNTFRDANGSAITLQKGLAATSLSGKVDDNTIGVGGVTNSGTVSGNGVFLSAAGAGVVTIAVRNNVIRNYGGNAGIYADNTDGSYKLDLTITGNTVAEPGSNAFAGLAVTAGAPGSGDDIDVCAAISGNNVSAGDPLDMNDIIVGVSTGASSMRLPGYMGTTLGDVEAFVLGNNSAAGTVVDAYVDAPATAANFTGGAACNVP